MGTLLDLVNAACLELGLPTTTVVVASGDIQIAQLLGLANREGREQVAAPVQWPQLQKVQTITLINGQASYSFPTDFNSYIAETVWNPTMRWPVAGPVSPQAWEFLKSGLVNSQPWMRYRIWQRQIFFDPVPTSSNAGQTVTIEYQSNSYCLNSGGTPQSKWAADTDTFALPEDILTLGIKWRFLAAKRFDYSEEKREYQMAVDRELSRAYGARTLPLNSLAWANMGNGSIQAGDFPGR